MNPAPCSHRSPTMSSHKLPICHIVLVLGKGAWWCHCTIIIYQVSEQTTDSKFAKGEVYMQEFSRWQAIAASSVHSLRQVAFHVMEFLTCHPIPLTSSIVLMCLLLFNPSPEVELTAYVFLITCRFNYSTIPCSYIWLQRPQSTSRLSPCKEAEFLKGTHLQERWSCRDDSGGPKIPCAF